MRLVGQEARCDECLVRGLSVDGARQQSGYCATAIRGPGLSSVCTGSPVKLLHTMYCFTSEPLATFLRRQ